MTELRCLTKPVVIHVAKKDQSLVAYQAEVVDRMSDQGVALQERGVKVVEGLRENLISVRELTKAGRSFVPVRQIGSNVEEGWTFDCIGIPQERFVR